MKKSGIFSIVFTGVVLALSGCGGGGSSTPAPTPTPVPTPTPTPTPAPAPAPVPVTPPGPNEATYTNFESAHVRPIAIDNENRRLFAVNTPNGSVELFDIGAQGDLTHKSSVRVGLEPVALALNGSYLWVVNHLSDSVSIIDTSPETPQIVNTIDVGDEPRDIVFAGEDFSKVFITTAHRGQNSPVDPQLTTPGVGRADVWVFETSEQTMASLTSPVDIVTLFSDTPRALAVTPDGKTVYAAAYLSGNQTTTIGASHIPKVGPAQSKDGHFAPDTGLIVQYDGSKWHDENGIDFSERVRFNLPDYDVFALNSDTLDVEQRFAGVGTHLFNMAVNPVSGELYVSNQEANNLHRFEGKSEDVDTIRGNIVQSQVTVVDPDASNAVLPVHLNPHIDYSNKTGTSEERELSLAMPMGMAITGDGKEVLLAAFSSAKLARFSTNALKLADLSAKNVQQIALSAGGPTSVVLDDNGQYAYTLTRFDNGLSVIDLSQNQESQHLTMFNPEPGNVVDGRRFLYDAKFSSAHGDASCGSCHLFGDLDGLAWDLGDPEGEVKANPTAYALEFDDARPYFHPLKGPMTTQSFRGMTGNGPMHWRGDRTGAQKQPGETLEHAAFKEFNPAFVGLLGRTNELSEEEINAFASFALSMSYPPNPIRNLDNSLTTIQAQGRQIYLQEVTVPDTDGGGAQCTTCHTLDVNKKQFGTNGLMSFDGDHISEDFKIPHLRNMYQKVGMFGRTGYFVPGGPSPQMGDQIKGFGFLHDGSVDTLSNFLTAEVFDLEDESKRRKLEAFVLAFDTELAPIVGQQVTLSASASEQQLSKAELLLRRAQRMECDLFATGMIDGVYRGVMHLGNNDWQSDKKEQTFTTDQLDKLLEEEGNRLTFTCAPPGSGYRMAIDKDLDGIYDLDI